MINFVKSKFDVLKFSKISKMPNTIAQKSWYYESYYIGSISGEYIWGSTARHYFNTKQAAEQQQLIDILES